MPASVAEKNSILLVLRAIFKNLKNCRQQSSDDDYLGSHESCQPLVKVRRSRIKGPVEIVAVGLEHATKIQNLKIKDGLLSAFDFGERATADVQTCKLKLGRKLFLRPPAFVPQSPNLRSYDIAVPHRVRATQAPIAKGQSALSWFVSKLSEFVTK
jgi:hypothetical protein